MNFSTETNKAILLALSDQFEQFHRLLERRDVASKVLEMPKEPLSENGVTFEHLNQYITDIIQPNLSASNGGRYWGFVTGGANPVATYADWLVTTYNQNVSKGGDSIATSIEHQTLKWLCELFELPHSFKGIVTTGATSANLLATFTARQFAGHQQNIDIAKEGMSKLSVDIFSATPHASMIKSLGMSGFGQNSWQPVLCERNSEAMDVSSLAEALSKSEYKSKIVIASAATVTGTDYDNLFAIAELCKKYKAWLHVDAAFGIFERLISGTQGKTKGIEFADSITLDCHKWLNVPYDCGVFLTKHIEHLQGACNVDAPYLKADDADIPFMSLGVENSRRFRAFPVWATLKAYGKEGIKQKILSNIYHAKKVATWIENADDFTLVKPCELNVILFQPDQTNLNMSCAECMDKLNLSGKVFVTPGMWKGKPVIRAAISNWSTTDEDIETVISTLKNIKRL